MYISQITEESYREIFSVDFEIRPLRYIVVRSLIRNF